tara:strand:+ start:3816 stop:5243 length:1428 start_codon:yes stop_codon:yes gene_type:complete
MGSSHSHHKKSSSTANTYSVSTNNWLDTTTKAVADNSTNQQSSLILSPNPDPAYGCNKEFVSSYSCGPNTTLKTISLDAPADGKAAVFDCKSEYLNCTDGRLTVGDDGNVTFSKSDGTIIWQSDTNSVGLSKDEYKAVNGKYERNYLLTGEYLLPGEFIGSPSGNCALLCQSTGKNTHSLDIIYFEPSCNQQGKEPTSTGEYGDITDNKNTQAAYDMSQGSQSNTNANKIVYSSGDMKTKAYRNKDISNSDSYISIGNFDLDAINLKSFSDIDINTCKSKCNSINKCGGYIYNNDTQTCNLRESKHLYPENTNRVSSANSEMFIRQLKVLNPNSCSGEVNTTTGNIFSNLDSDSPMTSKTLCGLAEATKKQRLLVDSSLKQLNAQKNTLNNNTTSLMQSNSELDKGMIKSLGKEQDDLKNYDLISKKTKLVNKKLVDVSGMEEDANLEMISNNIKNSAWTAVVLVSVIIAIKFSR